MDTFFYIPFNEFKFFLINTTNALIKCSNCRFGPNINITSHFNEVSMRSSDKYTQPDPNASINLYISPKTGKKRHSLSWGECIVRRWNLSSSKRLSRNLRRELFIDLTIHSKIIPLPNFDQKILVLSI